MDSRRRNTKRFPPKSSSLSDTTRREPGKRGFESLDPAQLGLEGPAWLAAPSPPKESFDNLLPSPQAVPVLPPPLPTEDMPVSENAPYVRTLLEGMKVVCICKGIKKSIFWKALDTGAQTTEEINHLTGAGSGGCSGRRCGPRIAEMLRNRS